MYDRNKLIDVFRQRALKFGDFTLASGKKASYYLDGKPIRAFAFVGITEYFDVSLRLFMRVFDCERTVVVPPANQNPERVSSRYVLTPEARQRIVACNQQDIELYQDGLAYFHELCRCHGLQVEAAPAPAAAQAS